MSGLTKIAEITAGDFMLREVNKGLMVQWINDRLLDRADSDVRTSVVFYDAHRLFLTAANPAFDEASLVEFEDALYRAGARFWSRGVK